MTSKFIIRYYDKNHLYDFKRIICKDKYVILHYFMPYCSERRNVWYYISKKLPRLKKTIPIYRNVILYHLKINQTDDVLPYLQYYKNGILHYKITNCNKISIDHFFHHVMK